LEVGRKFRVLVQTLSMHTALRDRYARRALFVDILLLACAVIFCTATFADATTLAQLGLAPKRINYLLRVSSVLAFMLSILSLRIDWKGKSSSHRDAADKMSRALEAFRNAQQSDGTWPTEGIAELDAAYWEAMHNSVPIPEGVFVKLKARHLRKVQLSRMLDSNPGCPAWVLRLVLLWVSLRRALGGKEREEGNA
jgi:hypothetical protein